MWRRFGTIFELYLQRWCKQEHSLHHLRRWNRVFRNVGIYSLDGTGITLQKEYNIQKTAKVWIYEQLFIGVEMSAGLIISNRRFKFGSQIEPNNFANNSRYFSTLKQLHNWCKYVQSMLFFSLSYHIIYWFNETHIFTVGFVFILQRIDLQIRILWCSVTLMQQHGFAFTAFSDPFYQHYPIVWWFWYEDPNPPPPSLQTFLPIPPFQIFTVDG